MTTTSRPFASVKWVISGPPAAAAPAKVAAIRPVTAAVNANVRLWGTNSLSRSYGAAPQCTFDARARGQVQTPTRRRLVAGWRSAGPASLALRTADRRVFRLRHGVGVLRRPEPVRLTGRGGLVAGGRFGHGGARRLPGERSGFCLLVWAEARKQRTERVLGAELGRAHQTLGVFDRPRRTVGAAVAALAGSAAGVEFARPQRTRLLFCGYAALELGLLGGGLLLAALDVRVDRPSRVLDGAGGFALRGRKGAVGRQDQRRALAV